MSQNEPTTGSSSDASHKTDKPSDPAPTGANPPSDGAPQLSKKRESSWPSVLFYIHLNILGLYGIAVLFTNAYFVTILFTFVLSLIGILGVTTGAHRLWAHRSYTASPFLRTILMLCQTMAGQGSIYDWVKMHRLHHQTFKTADDPFYSDKEFVDAQVLAQIRDLSPHQKELLKHVDVKDLETDSIVMFQKRFYWLLYAVFFVLLPMNAPLEYWDDSIQAAIFVATMLRYLIVLNVSWLVNSAHFIWGLDKRFKPSDSNMIFLVTKSYWPQYHYLLPWDYQTGEFGEYGTGCSTAFIRVFAALGMATDLQTVTSNAVKAGLTRAVESGRPVVDCLTEAAKEDIARMPSDHFLKPNI